GSLVSGIDAALGSIVISHHWRDGSAICWPPRLEIGGSSAFHLYSVVKDRISSPSCPMIPGRGRKSFLLPDWIPGNTIRTLPASCFLFRRDRLRPSGGFQAPSLHSCSFQARVELIHIVAWPLTGWVRPSEQ